jgi:hypothetical protein
VRTLRHAKWDAGLIVKFIPAKPDSPDLSLRAICHVRFEIRRRQPSPKLIGHYVIRPAGNDQSQISHDKWRIFFLLRQSLGPSHFGQGFDALMPFERRLAA